MGWKNGTFTRSNGTYSGATVWASDDAAGTNIETSEHDTHDQDLATGINACIAKDGSNQFTGNLNMGSNKITSVANGTNLQDAACYGQTITSFTVSGTTVTGVKANDTDVSFSLSGFVQTSGLTADLPAGGYTITNLADATSAQEPTTLSQVNSMVTLGGSPSSVNILGLDGTALTPLAGLRLDSAGTSLEECPHAASSMYKFNNF